MVIDIAIVLTVAQAIGIVNILFKIFRRIRTWLKNRDPLFKENHRMLKILKAYFNRNTNSNQILPAHIKVMMQTLEERKHDWSEAPGAIEAEDEAVEQDRYRDVGYTTEYEPSDISEEDEECSPTESSDGEDDDEDDDDDDSPDNSDSPVQSSDDEEDSPLVETNSPLYSSDEEDDSD